MTVIFALTLILLTPRIAQDADYASRVRTMEVTRLEMVTFGVMEENETLFRTPWWLEQDLHEVRWRLANVPTDAPPVSDVQNLPSYSYSMDCWRDSLRYREYLLWLRANHDLLYIRLEAIDEMLDGQDYRIGVWDLIADAAAPVNYRKGGRRWLLQQLRLAVGSEKYNLQQWPSHLPLDALDGSWRKP